MADVPDPSARPVALVSVPASDDFRRVRALLHKACTRAGYRPVARPNGQSPAIVVADVSPASGTARAPVISALRVANRAGIPVVAVTSRPGDDVPDELGDGPVLEYTAGKLTDLARPLMGALRDPQAATSGHPPASSASSPSTLRSGSATDESFWRRRWPHLAIGGGAVVVVLLGIALGIGLGASAPDGDLRYDEELYDRTLADLRAANAEGAPGRDAGPLVRDAMAAIDHWEATNEREWSVETLAPLYDPQPDDSFTDPVPLEQLGPWLHRAAADDGPLAGALADLRQARDLPACHWPVNFDDPATDWLDALPILDTMSTVRLLCALARLELVAGRPDAALEYWRDAVGFAAHVGRLRILIAAMVQQACVGIVTRSIRWAALDGLLPDDALTDADVLVARAAGSWPTIHDCLRAEYVFLIGALREVRDDPQRQRLPGGLDPATVMLPQEAAFGTEVYHEALEIAASGRPFHRIIPELEAINQRMAAVATGGGYQTGMMVALVMPDVLGIFRRRAEARTNLTATRIVLELERTRARDGRYPADLPGDLTATDYVTGGRLQYIRTSEQSYRLASSEQPDDPFVPLPGPGDSDGNPDTERTFACTLPVAWYTRPPGSRADWEYSGSGEFVGVDRGARVRLEVRPASTFPEDDPPEFAPSDPAWVDSLRWYPESRRIDEVVLEGVTLATPELVAALRAQLGDGPVITVRCVSYLDGMLLQSRRAGTSDEWEPLDEVRLGDEVELKLVVRDDEPAAAIADTLGGSVLRERVTNLTTRTGDDGDYRAHVRALGELAGRLPALREMVVSGRWFTDSTLREFASAFRDSTLEILYLRFLSRETTVEGLASVTTIQSLRTLRVDSYALRDGDWPELRRRLGNITLEIVE